MSDLVPRKRSGMSRGRQVDRAYQLVVATGVGAAVFAVAVILAIVGVIGAGVPLLAALATAGFAYGTYRAVHR